MSQPTQADAPRTGNRQYHIALEAGELAEYVLLVGDPGRVAKVAANWDAIELERSNREITTATGTYRGMRLSCMSTGMGTDNIEIVLAEVMEITDHPTFIRVGSSGALQPEIDLGDLIVSTGAVRLENTTDFYVHPGFPAIAHRDVVWALEQSCREQGIRYHVGLTATASGEVIASSGVDLPEQVDAGQSGIYAACLRGLLCRAFQKRAVGPLCVGRADGSRPQSRQVCQHEKCRRLHFEIRHPLAAKLFYKLRIPNWERAHLPSLRSVKPARRGGQPNVVPDPLFSAALLERPHDVAMGDCREAGVDVEVGRVLQANGTCRDDEVAQADLGLKRAG